MDQSFNNNNNNDLNNLNTANNEMGNNQPLNNNVYTQSQQVNSNIVQQSVEQNNTQFNQNPQPQYVEQPVQSTPQQPTNNYNEEKAKKSKVGLIIAVVLIIVAIVVGCIFLLGQGNKNNNDSKNDNNNTNTEETNNAPINTNNNKKQIEDYTWKDLTIAIDGNLIYPSIDIETLLNYGFEFTGNNSDTELSKNQSLNVRLKYKNSNVNEAHVYNVSDEVKTVRKTTLDYIKINDEFINNYNVQLPKGLLLTQNTTIDEIVNSMGNYSKEIAGAYYWELENEMSSMEIGFRNDRISYIRLEYTIATVERALKQ